jgi:hypothetical protein
MARSSIYGVDEERNELQEKQGVLSIMPGQDQPKQWMEIAWRHYTPFSSFGQHAGLGWLMCVGSLHSRTHTASPQTKRVETKASVLHSYHRSVGRTGGRFACSLGLKEIWMIWLQERERLVHDCVCCRTLLAVEAGSSRDICEVGHLRTHTSSQLHPRALRMSSATCFTLTD